MGHLNDLHSWSGRWSDSHALSWEHRKLKPKKRVGTVFLGESVATEAQGVQEAGSFVKTGCWDQVSLSSHNCESPLNIFWSHISSVFTSLGLTAMVSVLNHWPVYLHPLWYSGFQSCYTVESPGKMKKNPYIPAASRPTKSVGTQASIFLKTV